MFAAWTVMHSPKDPVERAGLAAHQLAAAPSHRLLVLGKRRRGRPEHSLRRPLRRLVPVVLQPGLPARVSLDGRAKPRGRRALGLLCGLAALTAHIVLALYVLAALPQPAGGLRCEDRPEHQHAVPQEALHRQLRGHGAPVQDGRPVRAGSRVVAAAGGGVVLRHRQPERLQPLEVLRAQLVRCRALEHTDPAEVLRRGGSTQQSAGASRPPAAGHPAGGRGQAGQAGQRPATRPPPARRTGSGSRAAAAAAAAGRRRSRRRAAPPAGAAGAAGGGRAPCEATWHAGGQH